MARRVGIELSSSRCALVDLDERRVDVHVPARVRSFRAIPWSPQNVAPFVATLRLLRKSNIVPGRAVVALWDLDATYHHFSLPSGDDARLRLQAIREVRATAPAAGHVYAVLVDRAAASVARDVTVVAAPPAQVQARLAPLLAADFEIDAVVTPAMALASLGRLLPDLGDNEVRACVAVNADATALAIVRGGLVLLARELALPARAGPAESGAEGRVASLDALDFARRLAPEIKRSILLLRQQSTLEVRQVVLCGEFGNLRALTAPLETALNLDVATLDGIQGLAAAGTVDGEIRDRAAAARIAWSAGATGSRLASLLPSSTTTGGWGAFAWRLAPRAALFVLLAGLTAIGLIAWTRVATPRASHPGRSGSTAAATVTTTTDRRVAANVPASGAAQVAPAPSVQSPARRTRAGARDARQRPASAEQGHGGAPGPSGIVRSARTPAAVVADDPVDPVIDSILYGPDRRLALIGHRVMRVGDQVAAGVIAAIEPAAVIIRRPSGELRRVEMKRSK